MGVAVFNGDATTSNDADAIAGENVPVMQIATSTAATSMRTSSARR